ncbi:MAG: phosphotyrosine protein phosphatase [bacterium]|nr:phosphotyrosine protein phosphatase [bacterium]
MNSRINLLFVCTYNQMRSRTGEELYKDDGRFLTKSAGIDADAEVRVSAEILEWADCIVVMEQIHLTWIRRFFPGSIEGKKVLLLDIPDNYFYMESSLIPLLRERFEEHYGGLQ